ncbi:MAG: hypothetical protein AAGC60_09135 [Acidobacteriota bacterium]
MEPEYLVCVECETPCYTFTYENDHLTEAQCLMCGNEDVDTFLKEDDFEALMGSAH